jgi:hypothetical protein
MSKSKGMGPAKPIKAFGGVHWGWFFQVPGQRRMLVTACGQGANCCRRVRISGAKVKCKECLQKAKADPGLIRGTK